jgi:hypothetical protein
MNRVRAVVAGVALVATACGGAPKDAGEFRAAAATSVDTAHSAIETVDLVLAETGRGDMTSVLGRITLADAAKELSATASAVRAMPAPDTGELKDEIVAALAEAAAVADQSGDGLDRARAAALEPRARAAADRLIGIAGKLPPPD